MDVLISRRPWTAENELHFLSEHFEELFNAASAALGT